MTDLRPDIEAAERLMRPRLGVGREIRDLVHHLHHHEVVRIMAIGLRGATSGLIVLTDRRVLFMKHGAPKKTVELGLDVLSLVHWNGGRVQGTLRVYGAGQRLDFTAVRAEHGQWLADAIQQYIDSRPNHRAERNPSHATSGRAIGYAGVDRPARPAPPPPSYGQYGAGDAASLPSQHQADAHRLIGMVDQLRDAGVLTPDEAAAKRAEVLLGSEPGLH